MAEGTKCAFRVWPHVQDSVIFTILETPAPRSIVSATMTKRIDPKTLPVSSGTTYPAPYDEPCRARHRIRLGDAAGLTQYGVNLLRLEPGAWSSQRHWHTGGDEFSLFLLDAARRDMAKLQAEAGTNLEASVVAGGVGRVVRQVALDHRSGLLGIGRGVMHETLGRLRTQSYEVIRQSPCPVLSL